MNWNRYGTLWDGVRSMRRLLLCGLALAAVYAIALGVSWIHSLFPAPRDGVIVGRSRTRIVSNVEIREVAKWRERVVPCVDLVELLPKGATEGGFTPRGDEPAEPAKRDERRAEKERERFEDVFAGKVDLGESHLLRTLDIGSSRWGWKIAATIPKEQETDEAGNPKPRKVELTAAEKKAPLFGAGKRSAIWLGVGGLYRDRELVPAIGAGVELEAFTIKKALGTVRLFGGMDEHGEPTGFALLTLGAERWRIRSSDE